MMVHLFLCIAYLLLGCAILRHENTRRLRDGFDSFHVILFFYGLYVVASSVVIHAILAAEPNIETGVYFFDSVYKKLDAHQAVTVFLLNLVFLAGFYFIRHRFAGSGQPLHERRFALQLRPRVLAVWLLLGVFACGLFFMGLGTTFIERYANLILFRSLDDSAERNFFTANAFTITMTFSWLSAALMFRYQQLRKRPLFLLFLGLTIYFSFLMGSRRGFVFPIIIVYLSYAITHNKTFLKQLAYVAPILVLWISVGKNLTGAIAYDNDAVEALNTYSSTSAGLLRAVSDIGISQVQSFGTLQHFDFEPRYGIDHLLSILRRIPGKSLMGISDYFPEHERITRITTALFTSPTDADIAPGLIGASWLDFPVIGAFLWGIGLALQCGIVEYCRSRVRPGPNSTAVVVLISTIIAMPINTGTYDFTISVDIVLLIIVMATSIKCKRVVVGFSSSKKLSITANHQTRAPQL